MAERITIMLDKANVEKLRQIQAKMIRNSNKSVSFSRVLNLAVARGLKNIKA